MRLTRGEFADLPGEGIALVPRGGGCGTDAGQGVLVHAGRSTQGVGNRRARKAQRLGQSAKGRSGHGEIGQ